MKKLLISVLALFALTSAPLFAVNPLPPDTKFQGQKNVVPTNTTFIVQGTLVAVAGSTIDLSAATVKAASQSIGASTAAAGSTYADAGALPAGTARVYSTTGADGTKGVILNTADKVTGRQVFIGNTVPGNALKVYAPAGGTINGASANTAFVSANGKGVIVICLNSSTNAWLAW